MSKQDDRVFGRITELVSLLSNPAEEITIAKIARLTNTTREQTREDLHQLHTGGLSLEPESVFKNMQSFETRYDDIPVSLAQELPVEHLPGTELLFLNAIERNLFLQKGLSQLRIKNSPAGVSYTVRRCAQVIEEAIREGKSVRFRYRQPDAAAAETIEITPHFLYFNATDHLYYCISCRGEEIVPFRLDRIQHDVTVTGAADEVIDPPDERLKRLRDVWGAAFSSDEEPVSVKIRIENNTADSLGRIRADITGRPNARLWEEGGDYYYEDRIIGMDSFRAWIMSFGSSVKVLEPASLAKEILESSRERLSDYQQFRE